MTKGGGDAGDLRKKKTRQKGLVQSPSLGSVLWFTGLEHCHQETPADCDRLRAVSMRQAPATCGPRDGAGRGGPGSQEAAAVQAVGLGAPLFFPSDSILQKGDSFR